MSFPPRIHTDIATAFAAATENSAFATYWRERAEQHVLDSYVGVSLSKFPEDLRAYEHLLWDQQPDILLELGCQHGGSTLWFRDRLLALARYEGWTNQVCRVVAVDIDISSARDHLTSADPDWEDRITLIEGDICDPALVERVRAEIPSGANTMVVEDSAHTEHTTRCALENFADFVPVHGYFVVEDGLVDIDALRIHENWPRGVLPAVDRWLESPAGGCFEQRRDLEFYGVTSHPFGILRRTSAAPSASDAEVKPPPSRVRPAVAANPPAPPVSKAALPMLAATPWQMSPGERAALEGILAQCKPSLALEIGTAEGGSLSRIAEYADEVHSIDLVEPKLAVAGLPHVNIHTGDCRQLLPDLLARFAASGRNIDFALVDGDHSAAGVRQDIIDLLDSDAVSETVIVLHDTINEEVRRGIDDIDYAAYEKVRFCDFDAVPGTISVDADYRGQFWGGLGVIICTRTEPGVAAAGIMNERIVRPDAVAMGARALAGYEVNRNTDFAELARASASNQPLASDQPLASELPEPANIPWRTVLAALATFPGRLRRRVRRDRPRA
ncbi:MAG: class I SAM-dependent methyltransferase [Thermoleophilaceae bacterium]|nr:class I SAM-dependent methyltransferase [Thermoleophilaceae bacterium]